MTSAFGLPADDFDLEAWIGGAKLPERACTVYSRPDLVGQYEALDADLRRLQSRDDDESADERLGTKSEPQRIAAQMDAIRREMDASARVFKFRSLAPGELDEIKDAAGKGAQPEELTFRVLATQCVQPAGITWEQFKTLYQALGDGYFNATILQTANEAREANAVALPFSLAASVARRTEDS